MAKLSVTHSLDLGFVKKFRLSDGREVVESELAALGLSPPTPAPADPPPVQAVTPDPAPAPFAPLPPTKTPVIPIPRPDTFRPHDNIVPNTVTSIENKPLVDNETDTFTSGTIESTRSSAEVSQGVLFGDDGVFSDDEIDNSRKLKKSSFVSDVGDPDDFGEDIDGSGGSGQSQSSAAPNVQKAQGKANSANAINSNSGLTANIAEVVIEPRVNDLSDFASYTYNLELFMTSPKRYIELLKAPQSVNQILSNPRFSTPIIRSGGIASDGGEHFDLDFGIDNLVMTNVAMSPNTRSTNTNAVEVKFEINEPNGVTLLERLKNASKDALEESQNYLETPYILRLTFKGYDDNGREINGKIAPKHIPIKIIQISFNVTESGSRYKVQAIPYSHHIFSSITSTIPINVQVSAGTVQDVFQGAASIKDKVITESKRVDDTSDEDEEQQFKTVTATKNVFGEAHTTLQDAMNNFYNEKTKPKTDKEGKRSPSDAMIADKISFKFAPEIANAQVQTEKFDALNTPQATQKAYKSISNAVKGKLTVDKENNVFKINAGTNITSLLNYVIVASNYLSYNINDDAGLQEVQTSEGGLRWFKIIPQILESLGWDEKEGRYKFHTEYTVIVNTVHYQDFPWSTPVAPKGKGIHKIYDYIFSGNNTEVQNYRLNFDLAYHNARTIGTGSPTADKDINNVHAKAKDVPGQSEAIVNDDSTSSKRKKDFFESVMTDGFDLINLDLDILGDPAYFPSGDAMFQPQGNNNSVYNEAFLPDGTINYDLSPPYVQVNLKTPTDYDPLTGLMNPSASSSLYTNSQFNGVYQVTSIKSTFQSGTFTQVLTGFRAKMQPIEGKVGRSKESIANTERKEAQQELISTVFGFLQLQKSLGQSVNSLSGLLSNTAGAVSNLFTDADNETDEFKKLSFNGDVSDDFEEQPTEEDALTASQRRAVDDIFI